MFLIYIGDILIIFIYVTRLASNGMFSLLSKIIVLIIPVTLIINIRKWIESNNKDILNQEIIISNDITALLRKLYNQPTGIITILLALYLF